ncbi:SRR1-like protein [Thrips palmi]|uniref:SRR1-like protein n=1 Tax=Thrips palmi TaxID=161013 RepID=A0A6P8ZPJ3_THRPL|nr:SRR1-like protein [Thrips palmi]XP_034244204.1 SRR1-like protein [Thrips palmi]
MSCDEFKLVTSRRRGKNSKRAASKPVQFNKQGETDTIVNIEKELQKIINARSTLDETPFKEGVQNILQNALDLRGEISIAEIICYGLGHFTECSIARYQLALLLSVKELFKGIIYVHDPIFHTSEVNILKELGFIIIEENEEGKRELSTSGTTFLYLPHCPKQLVNNFLWKNWGPRLKDCIIFGNSFSSIVERQTLTDQRLTYFLAKIQPYVEEYPIDNNFKFLDVFNDTSVHVFSEHKLSQLLPTFWSENRAEPVYPDSDLELILKKP